MTTAAIWTALIICAVQIGNSWLLKLYDRKKDATAKDNQAKNITNQKKVYKPFRFRFYHVLLSSVILSWSFYTIVWLLYFPTGNTNSDAFRIAVSILNMWLSFQTIGLEPFVEKRFDNISNTEDAIISNLKTQNEVNLHFKKQIEELQGKQNGNK